ncbi:hypothetical protein ACQEVB_15490 [Pseudonocardia sp. CA-107938]
MVIVAVAVAVRPSPSDTSSAAGTAGPAKIDRPGSSAPTWPPTAPHR